MYHLLVRPLSTLSFSISNLRFQAKNAGYIDEKFRCGILAIIPCDISLQFLLSFLLFSIIPISFLVWKLIYYPREITKMFSCSLSSCHSLSRSIHVYEISAFTSKIPMMMLNNCEKNLYVFLVPPLTNFFSFFYSRFKFSV